MAGTVRWEKEKKEERKEEKEGREGRKVSTTFVFTTKKEDRRMKKEKKEELMGSKSEQQAGNQADTAEGTLTTWLGYSSLLPQPYLAFISDLFSCHLEDSYFFLGFSSNFLS